MARLDGPRPVPGRAAARLGGRGRSTRSCRAQTAVERTTTRRPARWCGSASRPARRSRSPRPVARVGGAGPVAGRTAAHPPGRDHRRGGLLPGTHGCTPVEYLERLDWLGAGRLARPLRCTCRRAEIERLGATGTGVAHCPSSNGRLGAGTAPAGRCSTPAARSGWASTAPRPRRRAGSATSCARRCYAPRGPVRPAGAVVPGRRWRWPPSAAPAASAGPTRSARSSRASWPTWPCGGSTGSATPASRTRSPRWSSARSRRWSC